MGEGENSQNKFMQGKLVWKKFPQAVAPKKNSCKARKKIYADKWAGKKILCTENISFSADNYN